MDALTLGQKQRRFAGYLGRLLQRIEDSGYQVALGWAYRPPECAAHLAAAGLGIRSSLHTQKLAIDLDLFKDGVYLTATEDHQPFGEFWESLDGLCAWGGRWGDGNHYSLMHEGIR